MIIKYEKIYEGDDLAGSTLDLMFLRSPGGTIKAVYLYTGADVTEDDAVFNITKNGVALWADGERLLIAADSDRVSKTDLAITTVRGDVLMLSLEECPADGVVAPVTLILEIDDGEEAAAEINSTDDLPEGATNKYFTAARVWATVLTGIVFTTNAAITATDSILIAFGKIQAQITALIASVSTNTTNIASNTTAIGGKVSSNAAITGATKTKITYDAKGLVTAGADATGADVGLGSVTNDAQLKRAASDFAAFTEKTTPVSADLLLIEDSAAGGAKKKVQVSNLPSSGTVSGTSGKIAKFTGSAAVGDSNLSDDGTDITAGDKTLSRFSAKINDQTGTTYTLNAADNGKIVTFSNASAITVTIPSTLELGFSCVIYQKGVGQVTVVAGSGATIRNPNATAKTRSQYSTATVFSVVASEFVLAGDIAQS